MAQYEQITTYLKKYQEAQQKLNQIESNKKLLQSLVDLQKIQEIQASVQKRMGPYMCDNTQQQSKLQKNAYLDVLQDYKKEMEVSSTFQQRQYTKMKSRLLEKQQKIQEQFQDQLVTWKELRSSLQNSHLQITQADALDKISLQTHEAGIQVDNKLKQFEQELEISILQQELKRRKMMNELLEIAHL